jgi:hypothetical protein
VFPQDRVVLLVHADRIRNRLDLARRVDEVEIEIVDLAEAIATQRQRVRIDTDTVLADVERVLAPLGLDAVAVGHRHLDDRCTIDHRALAALVDVIVADVLQHEPLARREPHTEFPPLPRDLPAVDLVARSLGLRNLERFQVIAILAEEAPVVIALRFRHRNCSGVLDLDDFLSIEIHQRIQILDRVRVLHVVRFFAKIERRASDPVTGILVRTEVTDRPGIDADEVAIAQVESALAQRIGDLVVHLRGNLDLDKFVRRDRRLPLMPRRTERQHATLRQ